MQDGVIPLDAGMVMQSYLGRLGCDGHLACPVMGDLN